MPTLDEITTNVEKIIKKYGLRTSIKKYDEFTNYIRVNPDPTRENDPGEWTVSITYEPQDDENWSPEGEDWRLEILAYPPLFDIYPGEDELDIDAIANHYNVDLSKIQPLGDDRIDWVQVASVLIPQLLARIPDEDENQT